MIFNTAIQDSVNNTFETSWNQSFGFSFEQILTHKVRGLGEKAGDEREFGFSAEYGRGGSQSAAAINVG